MATGIIVIFILIVVAFVSPGDGRTPREKGVGTIVGGYKADKYEYPWHILLFYGDVFQCGGSILNEWTVLTVAHCIIRDEKQKRFKFSIVAGERNRDVANGKEQIIEVRRIVRRNDFNEVTFENDVALLYLREKLKWKKGVQPVVLADKEFDDRNIIGGDCWASGYGLVKNFPTNRLPKNLQELQVNVISNRKCNNKLKQYGDTVVESMVCSYDEGIGVCQGDSGGPMGCYDDDGTFRQVGIVSWTPTANCVVPPSVYMRVSFFLDWINDNMYNGPRPKQNVFVPLVQ